MLINYRDISDTQIRIGSEIITKTMDSTGYFSHITFDDSMIAKTPSRFTDACVLRLARNAFTSPCDFHSSMNLTNKRFEFDIVSHRKKR